MAGGIAQVGAEREGCRKGSGRRNLPETGGRNLPETGGDEMRRAWVMILMIWGGDLAAEPVSGLPSGQEVALLEVMANVPGNAGLAIRYRFLAPAIAREGGSVSADAAGQDMDWLCQNYALKNLPATGPVPSEVIISMSDRDLPFGESDPEATQFFNAYSIDGSNCLWEPF